MAVTIHNRRTGTTTTARDSATVIIRERRAPSPTVVFRERPAAPAPAPVVYRSTAATKEDLAVIAGVAIGATILIGGLLVLTALLSDGAVDDSEVIIID